MSATTGSSIRSTPWIRTSPAKMREARVKTRKRKLDPVRFAASSRKDLIRKLTQPGPGRSRHTRMTVTESISAVDRWKSLPPRVTRRTPSLSSIAPTVLFTGDTYYPAPIWLYRPETDLEAYAASIRRLAALAPQVKVVLGAHNIPVAPPSVLPRLVTAFQTIRAGTTYATPASAGRVIYKLDDISFLMRSPESKH